MKGNYYRNPNLQGIERVTIRSGILTPIPMPIFCLYLILYMRVTKLLHRSTFKYFSRSDKLHANNEIAFRFTNYCLYYTYGMLS